MNDTKKAYLRLEIPREELICCNNSYRSSTPAAAIGCSEELLGDSGAFFLPGPAETLTVAGLRSRSPRRNPRWHSSIIIPSLNSADSSLPIASCNYIEREKVT